MLITIRIIFWFFVLILLLVLVRLQVNWALACVIVVVESKCGLEQLWRSTYLMEGMRLVSLYLMLFFGAVIRVVWACLGTFLGSFSDVWKGLSFVLQIVMGSSIVAMFLLQNLASNAVLYMYCKVLHGELAGEIAVVGRLFGISIISAIRVGLLLALDGEFAFVAFVKLLIRQMICRTISLSVDLDVLARSLCSFFQNNLFHLLLLM